MSLDNAKMPSLKEKLRDQATAVETPVQEEKVSEKVEEGVSHKKGRRLNK